MPAKQIRRAVPYLAAALLLVAGCSAFAEAPLSVFARAIGSGEASGTVTGGLAEKAQSITNSNAPVTMHAKVVKKFAQLGCAHLAWDLTQEVPVKGGGTKPFKTLWGINVCVDGAPPKDAPDVRAFDKSAAPAPGAPQ